MEAIALAYIDVLRYLAANGPLPSGPALAHACGKVPSNLKRDWPKLTAAGYVENPLADETYGATDKARRLLQALEVADGRLALPDGFAAVRHDEIAPHPLNPRKRFEPEALNELRGDIVSTGYLIQSLLVRPVPEDLQANGVRFWLVAGERRWRAIGEAIFEGDWPEDRLLPAQVREMTDAEHLRQALSENIQRVDLDHVELAETFKQAIDRAGATPQSLADDLNKTPEYVQQHLRILRLPAETLDLVREGEISFHEALRRERLMRQGVDEFDLPTRTSAVPIATPAPTAPDAAPEPPLLDLTSAQAVVLVELADKARRDGVASFREGYTPVLAAADQDRDFAALVVAGAAGLRFSMGATEARIIPQGPGSAWLKAHGWAPRSDNGQTQETRFLLHSVRTELVGIDNAVQVLNSGAYLTPWLNPEPAAVAERQERLVNQHVEAVNRKAASPAEPEPEPYQPPLVAPSAEEQEDIDARAKWLAWAKVDADAINTMADDMAELMRLARGTGGIKGLQNWSDPVFPVEQLADTAVQVFAEGKVGTALMVLTMLRYRGGPMGAQEHLGRAIRRCGLQLTAEATA